jgi:hypothetical protein
VLARVIGQLIIGKDYADYNVRSHAVQPPLKDCQVACHHAIPLFRAEQLIYSMKKGAELWLR